MKKHISSETFSLSVRVNKSGGSTVSSRGHHVHGNQSLSRVAICFVIFVFLTLLLFATDLSVGSTDLPLKEVLKSLVGKPSDSLTRRIVIDIRLMKAAVALIAGLSLSVSGLQMQTLFRNPLAGPYVLGISSGASLGVALLILGAPSLAMSAISNGIGLAGAAWIGCAAVLVVIGLVSIRIRNIMVILILGMMFSSGVAAVVQILQYLSSNEALKSYVIWTMGSLGDVTAVQMGLLLPAVSVGAILAIATIKPLNLFLLGEEYALTSGLNVTRWRNVLFVSTTLLTGTVTAFCGPISFIGLAVPHISRAIFGTSDHRVLIPGCALAGACSMLLCDIISTQFLLPVNAITSLLGIPVVIWIVVRSH